MYSFKKNTYIYKVSKTVAQHVTKYPLTREYLLCIFLRPLTHEVGYLQCIPPIPEHTGPYALGTTQYSVLPCPASGCHRLWQVACGGDGCCTCPSQGHWNDRRVTAQHKEPKLSMFFKIPPLAFKLLKIASSVSCLPLWYMTFITEKTACSITHTFYKAELLLELCGNTCL